MSLATSGCASCQPHLLREDVRGAEVFDQLRAETVRRLRLRQSMRHPFVERPAPAGRGIGRSSDLADAITVTSASFEVVSTQRARSLPDDVRGSDPGVRKTTSDGHHAAFRRDPLHHFAPRRLFVRAHGTLQRSPRPGRAEPRIGADRDDRTLTYSAYPCSHAFSTSAGNTLRPATAMSSFDRPQTTRPPSVQVAEIAGL